MPLFLAVFGFLLIKAVILLPFYFKQLKGMMMVALFTSLAVVPFMTILYHETRVNFWFVYMVMILADIFIYYYLLQRNWWKAVPAAFLVNTFAIVFFYLGNG